MKALSVFSSRYLRIFLNLSPQLDLSDMKNMIFYGGWGGGGVSRKLHWKQDVGKTVLILKN